MIAQISLTMGLLFAAPSVQAEAKAKPAAAAKAKPAAAPKAKPAAAPKAKPAAAPKAKPAAATKAKPAAVKAALPAPLPVRLRERVKRGRKWIIDRARKVSLRTANSVRSLYDRTPPRWRHGTMTAVSALLTVGAFLATDGTLTTAQGIASAASGGVGLLTTINQGAKTIKAIWPYKVRTIKTRAKQSKVLRPWVEDSRTKAARERARANGGR